MPKDYVWWRNISKGIRMGSASEMIEALTFDQHEAETSSWINKPWSVLL